MRNTKKYGKIQQNTAKYKYKRRGWGGGGGGGRNAIKGEKTSAVPEIAQFSPAPTIPPSNTYCFTFISHQNHFQPFYQREVQGNLKMMTNMKILMNMMMKMTRKHTNIMNFNTINTIIVIIVIIVIIIIDSHPYCETQLLTDQKLSSPIFTCPVPSVPHR